MLNSVIAEKYFKLLFADFFTQRVLRKVRFLWKY